MPSQSDKERKGNQATTQDPTTLKHLTKMVNLLDKEFISKKTANNTYYYFNTMREKLYECKITKCVTYLNKNLQPIDTLVNLRTAMGDVVSVLSLDIPNELYRSIDDFQKHNKLYLKNNNMPFYCNALSYCYNNNYTIEKGDKLYTDELCCYIFHGNRPTRKFLSKNTNDTCMTYNHLTNEFKMTAFDTPMIIGGEEYKKYKNEAECLADNEIKVVRLQEDTEDTQEIQVEVIVKVNGKIAVHTETDTKNDCLNKLREAVKDLK